MRGDLTEVSIWVKGFNKSDIGKVLSLNEHPRTHSQGYKLDRYRFKKETGRIWLVN